MPRHSLNPAPTRRPAGRRVVAATLVTLGLLTASGCGSSSGSAGTMPSPTNMTKYTMAQVKTHHGASSCWAVIDGNVYDLTKWINQHPGGPDKILGICGTDASAAFQQQHSEDPEPKKRLGGFQIGVLG